MSRRAGDSIAKESQLFQLGLDHLSHTQLLCPEKPEVVNRWERELPLLNKLTPHHMKAKGVLSTSADNMDVKSLLKCPSLSRCVLHPHPVGMALRSPACASYPNLSC